MNTIAPIAQALTGGLWLRQGRAAVLLDESEGTPVWLRYALVTLGVEEHILPAFLLDDWGKERRGPDLYAWIREHGMHFPRAEVFGLNLDGVEEQLFLRELELYVNLPAYAVLDPRAPVSAGVPVEAVCLARTGAIRSIQPPARIRPPLCHIRAAWWQGDAGSLLRAGYRRAGA